MGLSLRTPALQAHSVLRFRQWRRVIEEYVAARRGEHPDDLLPQLVGHVSLAEAITAYEAWLKDEEADLECLPIEMGTELRAFLSQRSEARRGGKECVSPCRSRWAPYHQKKT